MSSVNKVILIGNLGRDPETRFAASGSAICNITLATSRQWKDRSTGERQEETEWHRIVLYDRLAEIAGEFLKKGSSCYIEGRLKTRKWQDKSGQDRYTTEIVADSLQLLGGKQDGDHAQQQSPQPRPAPNQYAAQRDGTGRAPVPVAQSHYPQPDQSQGFDDMDDSIPF